MAKPKIGDIMEIPTKKGFAYAQYTHQHAQFGALIRVFDVIFQKPHEELSHVAGSPVRFSTFFPIRAAVARGIFRIVGCADIADQNKGFPVFRAGIGDPGTKKVSVWWLWDGKTEQRVGEITDEQRKLPIRSGWNDKMLVERIEEGWRPESDPR